MRREKQKSDQSNLRGPSVQPDLMRIAALLAAAFEHSRQHAEARALPLDKKRCVDTDRPDASEPDAGRSA